MSSVSWLRAHHIFDAFFLRMIHTQKKKKEDWRQKEGESKRAHTRTQTHRQSEGLWLMIEDPRKYNPAYTNTYTKRHTPNAPNLNLIVRRALFLVFVAVILESNN